MPPWTHSAGRRKRFSVFSHEKAFVDRGNGICREKRFADFGKRLFGENLGARREKAL